MSRTAAKHGGRKAQIRSLAFQFKKLTEQINTLKKIRVNNLIENEFPKREFPEFNSSNAQWIVLREEHKTELKEEYKSLQAQRGAIFAKAEAITSGKNFMNYVNGLK